MNITTNYQLRPFNYGVRANNQQLQTNPSFGIKKDVVTTGAVVTAATALTAMNVLKSKTEPQEKETDMGKVVYTPKTKTKMQSLDVTRKNGMEVKLFDNIPQEVLESPVRAHMHQPKAHTVNPKVLVFHLVQNASTPIKAMKGIADGTVEICMAENNLNGVPMKFDTEKDNMYLSAPYTGRQYVSGNFVMANYGTTKWATDDYNKEFLDPATGEAPDIAVVADQKGSPDQSIMSADIADNQYDVILEDGTRIPLRYDEMDSGVVYTISKRPGVKLAGFVTPMEVTSSEDEKLSAKKFVMVDTKKHCYDANPIDRILKKDVTWLADMNDPAQAKIKAGIDEIFRLKEDAAKASDAGNKELADKLNKESKELTNKVKQEAAEWAEQAQKATGEEYFI